MNLGPGDLHLADPANDPRFAPGACDSRPRFVDSAEYRLLDLSGAPVTPARRRPFQLYDSARHLNEAWVPKFPVYFRCPILCGSSCPMPEDQGISRGWANLQPGDADCQWLDVTDVPFGDYLLQVTVNPDRALREAAYSNNTATVMVTIQDPPGLPHRPDGYLVPGDPVTASPAGETGALMVGYDVAFSPTTDYNLYYGLNTPVSSYLVVPVLGGRVRPRDVRERVGLNARPRSGETALVQRRGRPREPGGGPRARQPGARPTPERATFLPCDLGASFPRLPALTSLHLPPDSCRDR